MKLDEKTMMSVAHAAFRLARNSTPFCEAVWRRIQEPKIGELVVEYSRIAPHDAPKGLGRLVSHDRQEGMSEVERPDGTTVRLKSASFVAVPTLELIEEVDARLSGIWTERENATL